MWRATIRKIAELSIGESAECWRVTVYHGPVIHKVRDFGSKEFAWHWAVNSEDCNSITILE